MEEERTEECFRNQRQLGGTSLYQNTLYKHSVINTNLYQNTNLVSELISPPQLMVTSELFFTSPSLGHLEEHAPRHVHARDALGRALLLPILRHEPEELTHGNGT